MPVQWAASGVQKNNSVEFEVGMNKDRIKGKAKDVAGRIERQAGEWTGDKEHQAKGAAKQAEGKLQNAWGKAKDKAEDLHDEMKHKEHKEKDRNAA